jgi:5-methylcytosine-specific restriction endonuclease McrA
MKTCTGCHGAKPLAMFSRDWGSPGGYCVRCKACQAAYYKANRSRRLAYGTKYGAANRERVARATAAWLKAHPEKSSEYSAQRRARKLSAPSSPIPHETWADLRNDCRIFELLTGYAWAIDHIVPLARGGSHSAENLRALPARLNSVKNARLDHEVTSEEFQSHINATGSSFEQVTWRTFS